MTKAIKAQGSANTSYCPTVIEFILDETGSMQSCKAATLSGFNTFLEEQRNQPGTALLTLTKFDSRKGLVTPYTDLDVRFALPLNENTFNPGGGTNLRDAIGQRVEALEARLSTWTVKPNVLVVVMTDGEDNMSRAYSEHQVKNTIKAHESDGWTFVYLGATKNALTIAEQLGFQPGNSKQFEASEMHQTMTDLSRATTVYRAVRSETQTVSADQNFFR